MDDLKIELFDRFGQTKRLSGLYRGEEYQKHIGPLFSESGTYKRFFTFYSDGRVFMGSAIEGMDAFDPANEPVHGRYVVNNNSVHIQWVNDPPVSSIIAPDGSMTFYGIKYTPIPNCNGMKLNGAYGRKWDSESIEHKVIQFAANGTFFDTGILPQTALESSYKYLQSPPSWSNDAPLTGAGKYFIWHNTLYLIYDSGARESIEFYINHKYHGIIPPPQIVLGGWELELKNIQ